MRARGTASGWRQGALAVLAAGIVLVPAAHAGDALQNLLACRSIGSDAARLACFDRAAGTAPAAVAPSPPAAAAPASSSPAAGLDPHQTFGLSPVAISQREVAAGTRPADVAHISARISQLSSGDAGRQVFVLDNGQVWEQLRPEDVLAQTGQPVEISRGLFSSYWLKTAAGRGCKVRRLR